MLLNAVVSAVIQTDLADQGEESRLYLSIFGSRRHEVRKIMCPNTADSPLFGRPKNSTQKIVIFTTKRSLVSVIFGCGQLDKSILGVLLHHQWHQCLGSNHCHGRLGSNLLIFFDEFTTQKSSKFTNDLETNKMSNLPRIKIFSSSHKLRS